MHKGDAADLSGTTLELIAFHLGDQQFCIKTISIREIRGWAAATPLPRSPPGVIGVMNLRGSVIPIIDLAARLKVHSTIDTRYAAIVVAEIGGGIVGLIVDQVSDILSVQSRQIQPVPELGITFESHFCQGIIPLERGIVCLLDLDQVLANLEAEAA